ncbi:MAG: PD-(D/E)XK nuclease family protein [Cyanobacteria bacterium P01_C01_bin.89]
MADFGDSVDRNLGDHPKSLWSLNQSQLNMLSRCPRQFQDQFLEQRSLPASPQFHEAMEWGQRFHRLMERHILGLPIEPWLAGDRELGVCFNALQRSLAKTFPSFETLTGTKLCEHRRSLHMGDYLLTAIYDVLILEEERGLIIDWKTAAFPRSRTDLENDWQTKLYLYLLAETSVQPVESLTMVYWFVRSKESSKIIPSMVQFNYTESWHHKIQKELVNVLEHLTQWREAFLENNVPFPQDVQNSGYGDIHASARNKPLEDLPSSNSRPSLEVPAWDTIPAIKPDSL